jgi:hypothetical protein
MGGHTDDQTIAHAPQDDDNDRSRRCSNIGCALRTRGRDTWDNFLIAAEADHKARNPFGLRLGVTTDAVDWIGALLRAFGAELVDSNGNITAHSDAVRQVLDYAKRLTAFLPPDVDAWDNTSNNKFLVSGTGAYRQAQGGD